MSKLVDTRYNSKFGTDALNGRTIPAFAMPERLGWLAINLINEGSGFYRRTSDDIRISKIELSGVVDSVFTWDNEVPGQTNQYASLRAYRIVVLYDHKPDGQYPPWNRVFRNDLQDGPQADSQQRDTVLPNMSEQSRYTSLYDRWYQARCPSGQSQPYDQDTHIYTPLQVSLDVDLACSYSEATGSDGNVQLSDIEYGAVYVGLQYRLNFVSIPPYTRLSASYVGGLQADMICRVHFKDN